ncbi:MAG: hypothetical protein IE933_08945 [Sphingomonadales bacterium]|nr:hypothetical protein [Sphingomonadales bacterium]MBD3775243.1 hypothetical protein [Paracoccaceae bacterium]
MNAPFPLGQSAASDHETAIATFAWRGLCLDIFAAVEVDVGQTLAVLADAGVALDKEASHPGALARLRSLGKVLSAQTFGGHERRAARLVEQWTALCDERTALAHGLFRKDAGGVRIEQICYREGCREQMPARYYSRLDMLALLHRLDVGARELHGQLGQIRAACRRPGR